MQNYHNQKVDLSNCDKEPIHLIGRIQPHGFLLVLNQDNFLIEQVSANIQEYLSLPPEEILGKPFQTLFPSQQEVPTPELLLDSTPENPHILTLNKQSFFSFSHLSEGKIILECEAYVEYPDEEKLKHGSILTQLHQRLNALSDLESVAEEVAQVLLEILQYDRVDISRFDADWHSDVIAESRTERLSSFIGHHFPASDIPAPARELLLKKHVRQIPDANAQAVDIIPYYNPSTGAPTNILQSELRNPSEIHLEYVRNTGVAATISFSIIVKGKLWGVIACHHLEPTLIEFWRRQLCDLVTKTFANVIASIQEKRNLEEFSQYKQIEKELVTSLRNGLDITQGLFRQQPSLLDLTDSTGVALLRNGCFSTLGETPSEEQTYALAAWLSQNTTEDLFFTNQLSALFPEATAYQKIASGLLALELSRQHQEYLLFFKPEIRENRIWAGNPEKPKIGTGLHIHPRKSFEQWIEVVKGKSRPWTLNELEITQILLKDLIAIQLRNQTTELQKVNRELNVTADLLRSKNTQLEDFAYIVSHNLRSPLANIEGLYQLYKDDPSQEHGATTIEYIKRMSDNMSQTIEDLNVILRTHLIQDLPTEEISLAELIEKEKQNLEAVIQQTGAEIETDLQVPNVTIPKLYMESILHNFISNALKYHSPDRQPKVLIRSWKEQKQLHLSISDNGIGMDMELVGNKLFGLYKTFHKHEQAKGLGLYLTRQQIKILGGTVAVESELDKGTTFTIIFGPGKHLPDIDA